VTLAAARFVGSPRHVGAVIANVDTVIRGKASAQRIDCRGVTETVEGPIETLAGERFGDADSDAGGGAGDQGGPARDHDGAPGQRG